MGQSKVATLVISSNNVKVGDVSATYASIDGSCPSDCAQRNAGCYAQTGNVGIHTNQMNAINKLRKRQDARDVARVEARLIIKAISERRNTRPLRLHVSGDCRTTSAAETLSLAASRWAKPVWTYTHAWKVVARKSWRNVSVLASVDKHSDINLAFDRGYAPAIITASHPKDGKAYMMGTVKVIPCPAQTRDAKCDTCKLCWNADKLHAMRAAIAFEGHGVAKKRLTVMA